MADLTVELWIERLRQKIEGLAGDHPARVKALTLIGLQIQNEARKNLTSRSMIMTSNLRNSIRYRLVGSEDGSMVQVGAFGVPYARIHEKGGVVRPAMRRAMMRNLREAGRAGLPGKGVIRGSRFMARPYLAPAFRDSKEKILSYIVDMLREVIVEP